MAWAFVRYAPVDSPLYAIEEEDRAAARLVGDAAAGATLGVAAALTARFLRLRRGRARRRGRFGEHRREPGRKRGIAAHK